MSNAMNQVPGFLEGINTAQTVAGTMIQAAGSADVAGMSSAVCTAVGPIGVAAYLPGFLPGMATNLMQTVSVGFNHLMIGATTEVTKVTTAATDASFT